MAQDKTTPPRSDASPGPEGWKEIGSSGSFHRRFDFDDYASTSGFLDRLAELSEETGIFPDLSFATKYVSVTLHTSEDHDLAKRLSFADRANSFFEDKAS
ncbi:MAG: 4a-hydroxytetrahydrobiopterin dehydratase [Marinibacterium sp.]